MSTVRLRRLQADYEKLRAFLNRQPRIRLIQAQGTPPERYQLEFQIRGLREVDEQLQTVANHMVEIALPLSYPRLPPQCRMLTPVFHPNSCAARDDASATTGAAGEPLWSMVARIGEMIAYQSYNTKSPLNGEAARWVETHQDKLPLDRTNFMLDDAQPQNGDGEPWSMPPVTIPGPPPPAQPASAPLPMASPVAAPMAAPPKAVPPPLAARPSPPPIAAPVDVSVAANIVIQCGQCGSRYSVPGNAAGKRVRCKKCQSILLIPPPSQP